MDGRPDVIQFSVRGQPVAKGRARAHGRIVERGGELAVAISLSTPAQTRAVEELIGWTFRSRYPGHVPWVGAIMLQFSAVFPILESFNATQRRAALEGRLYHTAKPDKDNIEKLISDALNGLAWVDDAQLQGGGVKRYGAAPRIDVTLRRLEQPDTPADARRRKKLATPGLFR